MKRTILLIISVLFVFITSGLNPEEPDTLKPELMINTGHPQQIRHMEFSPDGKLIATDDLANSVILWDADTGKKIRDITNNITTGYSHEAIMGSFFSTNTKYIAVKYENNHPGRIFYTADGRLLLEFPSAYNYYTYAPIFAAFTPDEKFAAVPFQKKVLVIDTSNGKTVSELGGLFSGHSGIVFKLSFSSDGLMLASADINGGICIWNVKKGKELNKLNLNGIRVSGISFTPDSKNLIIRKYNGSFDIWDMKSTGIRTGTGQMPDMPVHDELSIDSDESEMRRKKKNFMYIGKGSVLKWEKKPEAPATFLQVEKGLWPDNILSDSFYASRDNRLVGARGIVIDGDTGKLKYRLDGINSTKRQVKYNESRKFLLSPDRKMIIIDEYDGNFSFRDTVTGKPLFTKKIDISQFRPISKQIAFTSDNRLWLYKRGDKNFFMNLKTGEIEPEVIMDKPGEKFIYLPDGKSVSEKEININNDTTISRLFSETIYCFSPDGRYAALNDVIIDLTSGKTLFKIDGKDQFLKYPSKLIVTSPDGSELAVLIQSATEQKDNERWANIVFINTASGKTTRSINLAIPDGAILYLQNFIFSNDGKRVFIYDNLNIYSCDSNTGKLLFSYPGTSAVTTPGDVIVSINNDVIQFHNSFTGEPLGAAGILKESFVVAARDGRYEAGADGMNYMHWVAGTEVIPLDSLDVKYKTKELFISLMNNTGFISDSETSSKKETSDEVDVSKHLIGKISAVQGNEIIVSSSRAADLIRMGDKLFVMVNGRKVTLIVTFPMMTVAKCKSANVSEIKKINKGMPVFK